MDAKIFTPIEELIPAIKNEGIISVEEFLKNPREIKAKIKYSGKPDGESFSEDLHLPLMVLLLELKNLPFENQVVVDLGAGPTANGYFVAKALGAKAYIGVEPAHTTGLLMNLSEEEGNNHIKALGDKTNPISPKKSVVPEDMLVFLKRLPSQSVSVLCSGLDHFILTYEYQHNVSQEITRVLHSQGAFMSYASQINPTNLALIHPKHETLRDIPTKLYERNND